MCTENRWLLAVGCLAATLAVSCGGDEIEPIAEQTRPPTRIDSPSSHVAPARFVDATESFGLDFTHSSGADGRKLLPETMGPGAALFDYDGDGDPDLFICNGRRWTDESELTVGHLYELDNGRFRDITAEAGLSAPAFSIVGQGVTSGDYDGDGDWDLYLTAFGPNLLLENREGRFVDVTTAAAVGGGTWRDERGREHHEWSTSAAFCDLDGDGWLDLFVCNYLEWSLANDVDFILTGDVKGYASPKLYRGSSCRLYRNNGDGSFEDVTASSGILSSEHKALGVSMVDVDGDARMDILVANDTQPNCLFMNRGDMFFEDIGRESGVGYDANGAVRAGMGIDAAYYASEGELAVAIGNFSEEPISFFRTRDSDQVIFSEDSMISGLGRSSGPSLTFATAFLDANCDGYLDLLAINGHIEPDIGLISSSTSWRQRPQLFLNLGDRGRFHDASDASGPVFKQALVGRGLALGDLDGDGDLDAVVTECGGPARVWRNDIDAARSLRLKLLAPSPNVHGVGAELRVTGGPFPQTSWVRTGNAYLGQHEAVLTFGLGETLTADVEVRWADGERSTHEGLEVGDLHTLKHPSLR